MGPDWETATDLELLRAAGWNANAFGVFYRRHERLVLGWLMNQTRNPELAADLAAEVFAAAYLGSAKFRVGPEPAAAWLLGIARNKVRGSARHSRVESHARRRLGMQPVALDDDDLRRVESLDGTLLAMVDQLPLDQREAVRARIVNDEDYREIAARMQVSSAVVRQRVSRGLTALREELEAQGESS